MPPLPHALPAGPARHEAGQLQDGRTLQPAQDRQQRQHNIWYVRIYISYVYLQYGAWASSKELPCLHKAYYRPQAYWPCQHRPQVYWPCQYAPAQHHNRWPARDQGCYGRTSHDTPANRSSRSRHDDAELLSRGKRSNRVVHCPVERTLSPSAGPKCFSSRGVHLVAVIHPRSAKG